jgi:hypothetical protein
MSLPWLESLPVWGDEPATGKTFSAPVRMAVVFSGNGFHGSEWWAKEENQSMTFGKVLQPLEKFKDHMLFIRGLYNPEACKGGIHSAQTGNLLTGAPLEGSGGVRSGISMDQLLANRIGRETKVPSLVLGCEPPVSAVNNGFSMIYSSHISWSTPTTATPVEMYPALAFDRLFRDDASKGDASVLDLVREDARRLSQRVSYTDRGRLHEYMESVREVEERIQQAGKNRRLQGWRPTLDKPNTPRPADGIPQDIDQHMRLMCDILVLAFQTDTTRICTLKLNNDHSALLFPHLGVDSMIHHQLSHGDTPDWLKVNQFFTSQLAYIAGKLDKIQEGERTALDNSMILFLSSMLVGSSHLSTQLPVVILGGAGGQLQTGRMLDYLDKPNRKMCSLYLSMMDKMGLHIPKFGDSEERLAEV